MIEKVVKDIEDNITLNMSDDKIDEFVTNYICGRCGEEFDKPGSCEECMDDERMQIHRDYIYNLSAKRRNYLKNNY